MNQPNRIEQLQQLLAKDAHDPFLHYALGLEFAKTEKTFALAEEKFNHVLLLDNNYFAAHYQLGQLFERSDRKEAAIQHYRIGNEKAKKAGNRKASNEFEEAIFLLED